jgi:glycine/D-amino acid oxidase-like deaminating enzyme
VNLADVVILGAGAVGANLAVFLAAFGFSVDLVESSADILQGASQAAFIHHGDGFEYYKPGHRRTGEYCIDGSLAKGLLYPLAALRTQICSPERPLRFLLTAESSARDGVSLPEFLGNARSMQQHYARRFKALRHALGWSLERMNSTFLRSPSTFWRPLVEAEYADVSGVVGGCAGSSFGINMAHYYAFLRNALRARKVGFHPSCETEAIEKLPVGFAVHAGGRVLRARQVVLAAGHQVPRLVSKIRGVRVTAPASGRYFLNSMTFLELPPTRDRERLAAARRINFALQQEYGGMFACLAPPSETETGLAVAYAPSSSASQLSAHAFEGRDAPPNDWDDIIRCGLSPEHPNVVGTWNRITRLYPFLKHYAKIRRTICRTVFNVSTADSNGGDDRRVREILANDPRVSECGGVSAWAAPKWTNAELVALMAMDDILRRLGATPLPRHREAGLGPTAIHVAPIADRLRLTALNEADARSYVETEQLPASLVDTSMVVTPS